MTNTSSDPEAFSSQTYDYLIVGGGTAGLVVAARLTEDSNVTVGVLEAGKNHLDDPLVDTPAAFKDMMMKEDYDWGFLTEPQKYNSNLNHHIPRGKMLGGSSGSNFLMYVRGSDQDYDDWAIITGDETWSSANMKPYMRKHQTLDPIDEAAAFDRSLCPFVGENHGTSGPIHTGFNDTFFPIEADLIKAFDDVTGMDKRPTDPYFGDHIGFYHTLGSIARTGPHKGKRSYAARTYFEPNAHRPNLHVLTEATVHKIELEGTTATGVTFSHGGKIFTAHANGEVIVSCGAIQSPQILELSGIGDPDVLKSAGVECKVANPAIGNNLQDHVLSAVGWEMKEGILTLDSLARPDVIQAAQKQLIEDQSGPLTCTSTTHGFFPYKKFATQAKQDEIIKSIEASMSDATTFQQKQYARIIAHLKADDSANLQVVVVPISCGYEAGVADQRKLLRAPDSLDALNQVMVIMALQYPVSRGSVHIKTANVEDHPALDPGFLSHPADVAVLGAGITMLGRSAQSPHLADKISRQVKPAPEVDICDPDQAEAWVRQWILSEYHPCGSVALGDALDTRLRVKGAKNLRVIDASVFPNHVSGNIQSSVYMVAERGADIIKEDRAAAVVQG
ncbi:unnamed protein product [Zymoseptoria tritici ST99CH_3D7]|uniref:Glucose-methanol-choline oxidoreductase N-terminal domain-containing protein n=1 Tax=Zymoseptoria tritici (strain ST99CH_3D7) TaxID=1276538 RepID=A0A1X7S430_ZYMT9|nr:unnamed protein product [Zymoseptoria tritici ST99CH_3D7]